MLKVFILSLLFYISGVSSHGRLIDPPNRSSLWRFLDNPFIAPYASVVEANYNDNELFCGGQQYQKNLGGKCGLCGDPFDKKRENEAGGKYGKGIIVAQYNEADLIEVTVELTTHHLGYFEFRLCVWNQPDVPGTFECLNQNLLKFSDGKTQFTPPEGKFHTVKLQLPAGVTCSQCILQWRYHTGNTWDCDETGKCCTGCGFQEEFYGCADITIGPGPVPTLPGWNQTTTTRPATTTTTTTTGGITHDPPPSTTTTGITTKSTSTESTACSGKAEGSYKHDCDTFYTCGANNQGPYMYNCGPGTVFDEIRKMCDFPHNVPPPCGTKET